MGELLETKPKKRNRFIAAAATAALLLSVPGCDDSSDKPARQTELQLSPDQQQRLDSKAARAVLSIAAEIRGYEWGYVQEEQKASLNLDDMNYVTDISANNMYFGNEYSDAVIRLKTSEMGGSRVIVRQMDSSLGLSRIVVENSSDTLDNLGSASLKSFVKDEDTHVTKVSCNYPSSELVIRDSVLSAWRTTNGGDQVEVSSDNLMNFAINKIGDASFAC